MYLSTRQRFVAVAAFFLCGAFLLGEGRSQEGAAPAARPKASIAGSRTADQDAAAAVMQSVAKSFEALDAAQLAAHWTSEGEFETVAGVVVRGRGELEKVFAELFAKTPEVSAQIHAKAFRFLSDDTAIEEGRVTIQRGPAEPVTEAHYVALLVRAAGKWSLAQLSESPVEEPSIEDLDWLIGDWKMAGGQGTEATATYAWDANHKFIHVRFARAQQELAVSGSQIIGIDPASGQIHSWIFEADGGVAEAYWRREGDHWTLGIGGTLADGRAIEETNVLRRIDDDTFTWQSIDRLLGESQLTDLPPVKVSRIKPKK